MKQITYGITVYQAHGTGVIARFSEFHEVFYPGLECELQAQRPENQRTLKYFAWCPLG